jgi:hypothetical protein
MPPFEMLLVEAVMTLADPDLELVLVVFEAKEDTGLISAARIGVTVSGDSGTL